MGCGELRRRRTRLKDFTYGRQWGDTTLLPDGRRMSEEARMQEEGRIPITNNIIRQMVKGIVGRYRYLSAQGDKGEALPSALLQGALDGNSSALSETDARTLEEFLISGMAIQRVDREKRRAEYVSPELIFFEAFRQADGSDCRLMGMLHDLAASEVLGRFSQGEPGRAGKLQQIMQRERRPEPLLKAGRDMDVDFHTPLIPGTFRVVEVWERQGREWLEVNDPFDGTLRRENPDALSRLEGLNLARREVGSRELEIRHACRDVWVERWLTPSGCVLMEREGGEPPFAVGFYPMIDGEIHSLVEDVLPQQKYVNRLISLLDHIISSSAKGVLLYPADQLPEGFTWRDLRRIWSTPNGIMPYQRTAKGVSPQQVHTGSAVGAGAAEMLRTQLELFEEISGSAQALRGRSRSAAGEGMLRAELENATIALLDVLACFRAFTERRRELLIINDEL